MIVSQLSDLPAEYTCKLCGETKPTVEMCVVRTHGGLRLRPRCKKCHNERERGHRREYKRNYLRRWRRRNKALTDSYWKDNDQIRERSRIRARAYVEKNHDVIAIRRRLSRRGISVTMGEAHELLATYGRCYPTRYGLTPEGLRECERIRSSQRRRGAKRKLTALEIRLMVYEDGLFIKPSRQPVPYKAAARNMSRWQRQQLEQKTQKALPRSSACVTLRATSVAATA